MHRRGECLIGQWEAGVGVADLVVDLAGNGEWAGRRVRVDGEGKVDDDVADVGIGGAEADEFDRLSGGIDRREECDVRDGVGGKDEREEAVDAGRVGGNVTAGGNVEDDGDDSLMAGGDGGEVEGGLKGGSWRAGEVAAEGKAVELCEGRGGGQKEKQEGEKAAVHRMYCRRVGAEPNDVGLVSWRRQRVLSRVRKESIGRLHNQGNRIWPFSPSPCTPGEGTRVASRHMRLPWHHNMGWLVNRNAPS